MSVSVVTPWYQHPELRAEYDAATAGAEVVIVETVDPATFSFAGTCNQGLALATGDVIVMLNNDITAAPGWLAQVEREVRGDGLYGPETHLKMVMGRPVLYVDGWCVAARREVWERLGGFDAETFQRPYWEDVDLSWRAVQLGYTLHQTRWPVQHLGNTTSRTTPGAYDASAANEAAFVAKVERAWMPA